MHHGFELAQKLKNTKIGLGIITEIAQVFSMRDVLAEAAHLLTFVLIHEATDRSPKDRAKQIVAQLKLAFAKEKRKLEHPDKLNLVEAIAAALDQLKDPLN